jgi:cytochrome c oxidase subunit 3
VTQPPDQLPDPDYPDTTGKQLHISGAGTIGMAVLIVSLSILFISSMVAFALIRVQAGPAWARGMPRLPNSLWLSTAIILCASVTIQLAYNAIRRGGPGDEPRLVRYLLLTLIIGLLFLLLQTFNWIEFYRALIKVTRLEGAYLGMFFVLTGLHAAHVVGGLIPLTVVLHRARQGRYSQNFHPGVRYSTMYWHFLDVVWIVLFLSIYF